ncbi:uncharacterized protein CELE_B0348.10 [Caenorhabditis elegans]|uniref:Secreted protein n=1 Tax=Caenorhabditis elegans TaxID=6239 RepID=A0A0K3ARQ1_CAEEL|nr:Secreted protein [Caenorhabditis elegans]CTQ86711.1 Secreted protein [Caenorhabditis elegans]|eukprot:NP_001300012.1 Uncharacterized protein CELE_B0348.10 [Caenorhabditis elegans]
MCMLWRLLLYVSVCMLTRARDTGTAHEFLTTTATLNAAEGEKKTETHSWINWRN